MGTNDGIIIKDIFEIGCRQHKFSLYRHQLTWWPLKRGGEDLSELINLKIVDIFNAELLCNSSDENRNKSSSGCCATPATDNSSWETLIVHFAQKKDNTDEWKPKKLKLSHSDPNVLNTWLSLLQSAINDLKHRPKNLLFFINPFGGKRRALKLFEHKVKPILEICKIKWHVVNTQRRNHATEALISMTQEKLDEYDVIVAVGGDGTVTEVVSGLLMRGLDISSPTTLDGLSPCKIPIAVIPAGSSNALAYTLHGTEDATTAAVHLLLGGNIPLDVGAIQNNNGISRFIVGQMSYGHLADTLLQSEKLRWMGPKRYTFAGLKKFLGHATYQGSIDMKIAVDEYTKGPTICGGGNGCEDCSNAAKGGGGDATRTGEWRRVEGHFLGVSGANISCKISLSPNGMAPFAHLCSGCLDLILVRKASRTSHLKFLLRTAGDSRRVFALPFVERYRVEEFIFTPIQCCEPANTGTTDSISRGPLMESGSVNSMVTCGCDARKQEKTHSVWNCDGELFLQPSVRVTVHKNLIRIMCRNQSSISQSSTFPSHDRNNSSSSSQTSTSYQSPYLWP